MIVMSTLTLIQEAEPLKVSPLTLIFLQEGNKILALKRAAHKQIYPNKWSGFGGKVEPGEDLFASAKREFLEETGLELGTLTLKGTLVRSTHTHLNYVYIFLADGYSGTLNTSSDEGEIAWRDKDELLNDAHLVDHLKLYLKQILEPNSDFFCAITNEDLSFFVNNSIHFEEREQKRNT